jgi:hypothetical protein
MSTPLLDLAQKYYDVAADLKFKGRNMIEAGESLERMADDICERNMREQPMPAGSPDQASEP